MKFPRKFGVELEIGENLQEDEESPNIIKKFSHSEMTSNGYWYTIFTDVIRLPDGWEGKHDGSCGFEFVSPPLFDTQQIYEVCSIVDEARDDGKIGWNMHDTGMHVHVDATDLDKDGVLAVGNFCRHFDRTIYSFVNKNRINNSYCRPVGADNNGLYWRFSQGDYAPRYYGCNIASKHKHNTIEFRYSEGTFDAQKIEALVDLFVCIVERCAIVGGHVCGSPKRNLTAKRKYLLDLVGVSPKSRQILLASKWD